MPMVTGAISGAAKVASDARIEVRVIQEVLEHSPSKNRVHRELDSIVNRCNFSDSWFPFKFT